MIMITDYKVTSYMEDEQCENYYRKTTDWERKEQIQAEMTDMAYEDSLFEED